MPPTVRPPAPAPGGIESESVWREILASTVNDLMVVLTDARGELADGHLLSAVGALTAVEHYADDLRAALRVIAAQRRREVTR